MSHPGPQKPLFVGGEETFVPTKGGPLDSSSLFARDYSNQSPPPGLVVSQSHPSFSSFSQSSPGTMATEDSSSATAVAGAGAPAAAYTMTVAAAPPPVPNAFVPPTTTSSSSGGANLAPRSGGPETAFVVTSGATAGGVSVPRVISGLSASSSGENLANGAAAARAGTTIHQGPNATEDVSMEGGENTTDRRQKRLERNRESARLSRRRRKQYLEVLEERVTELSQEMDKLRRTHVGVAVSTIQQKRYEALQQQHRQGAVSAAGTAATAATTAPPASLVPSPLSMVPSAAGAAGGTAASNLRALMYTSPELVLASVFRSQQLKSFCLPPHYKFIMWLTLQNDTFFRGGRAASERLSAARIGERMLQSGNDKVTPIQSMWPLVCNEVCLSYEQEEKARSFQRTLLQTKETWVDRHAAYSAHKTMESAQNALESSAARASQRENRAATVLSSQQRSNLLAYMARNRQTIAQKMALKAKPKQPLYDERYQTSKEQHVAANLYTLNYRLAKVLERNGKVQPMVEGLAKKKLSVRPCFETLGARSGDKKDVGSLDSFPSTGSLKRNSSEISMDTTLDEHGRQSVPSVSPENSQAVALPFVEQVLGHVKEIIPPPPVPATTSMVVTPSPVSYAVAPPAAVSSSAIASSATPAAPVSYSSAPVLVHHQHHAPQQLAPLPAPTPVASMSLQMQQLQPFVTSEAAAMTAQAQAQPQQQVLVQHPPAPTSMAPPPQVQHVQYAQPTASEQAQPVQYASVAPASAPQGYALAPVQHVQYAAAPAAQQQPQAPMQVQYAPNPLAVVAPTAPPAPASGATAAATGEPAAKHQRTSSFLPANLNVVPEEMWPEEDAQEFLMSLADEDWAVGAGVEMEF